jgi:hypothetical protein
MKKRPAILPTKYKNFQGGRRMKINLGYVFKDPHGHVVMDQEPRKDAEGKVIVVGAGTPTAQMIMDDTVPFILGEAIVRALDSDPDIIKADKKKKRDVWHLTERIVAAKAGGCDLSADEIVMVGDAIGKYYKSFIVGQAMDIMDPMPEPPAPAETPAE